MSHYRRPRAPGATWFFTVCLADRSADTLVAEVDLLRAAFLAGQRLRPVRCDAMVVLPDHLHAIWTLPPGDGDISTRWSALKARFTRSLREKHRADQPRRPGFSPAAPVPDSLPVVTSGRYAALKPGLRRDKRESAVWQRRFWDHLIRDQQDYALHLRYCWTNPVRHGLAARPADWPYSSIHRDIRRGLVAPDWQGEPVEGAFGEDRGRQGIGR